MPASDTYDVAIIGAGHNGLTCAAYLAKAGKRVIVLEAAEQVGGAAVTREFAPGYSVSACAHLLHQLNSTVSKDLALAQHGLQAAASRLKTVALSESGEHLTVASHSVTGKGLSASDKAAFPRFIKQMERFAAVLGSTFGERPPRLVNGDLKDTLALAKLGLRVRLLGRKDMRELLRIGAINIYDVLQEHFESELLKGLIGFDAVLGSHMGPRSPNSVLSYLYRLTGAVQGNGGGLSMPKGGMGTVTAALAAAAQAHGATIRTAAPVKHVVMDGARAVGVELDGGEQIRAAKVVSNADPKTTFLKLVGARNIEAGFVRRIHNIRMRGDAAKLHLALDALPQFKGLNESELGGRLVIAPDLVYVEHAFDHAKYAEYSAAPAIEITLPSIHDRSLAPESGHVLSAVAQYAPYNLKNGWDSARDTFANLLIDRIADFAPDIRDKIHAIELLTPVDIEAKFGITGGHWHHGELTLDQFLFVRPVPGAAQYSTPVDGLYLCGAGSHPGGGVMGLAGRNAARELIARENTK